MLKFYSPYVEIMGRQLPAHPQVIKSAGFDGIECHLIGNLLNQKRVIEVYDMARRAGLEVRFHQGWSWQSGQRCIYNMLLAPLGQLVPVGQSLKDQLSPVGHVPVVVYGNRVRDERLQTYQYQTAAECIDGYRYAMRFGYFHEYALRHKVPLVFDTQHILEWFFGTHSVAKLSENPTYLGDLVIALWHSLGPQVTEIHLNDYNPSRGGNWGRNLFPGEGIFPLRRFCQAVRASGWSGIVTPEVAFHHLQKPGRLTELCKAARRLFGKEHRLTLAA